MSDAVETILVGFVVSAIFFPAVRKICKRSGVGAGWSYAVLIPFFGPIVVLIIPFLSWPVLSRLTTDKADTDHA